MNKISLCYGPDVSQGILKHRPTRLEHLIDVLTFLGFHVSLERIQPINRLVIKLNGFQVFRSRLDYIKYEKIHKKSSTIDKAIWSALESRTRFALCFLN